MRSFKGNPHAEAHGRAMRCFDYVLPPGVEPHDAAISAETALGCKLWHRGDGEQHGYVNTSRLEDGGLYVCVVLYEDCDGAGCGAGHAGVTHRRTADPTPAKLAALASGEDRKRDPNNPGVRRTLGLP